MKHTIVNSKDIVGCMSPKRFLGECHECDQVVICKMSEAQKGRIKHWERLIRAREADLLHLKVLLKNELEGGEHT